MHVLARVRLAMARRPWIHWLLVVAAALGAAAAVGKTLHGVDAARRSWGEQQVVWIVPTDVMPGQPIAASRREVPMAMVPHDAATHDPTGAIARQHLSAGEVVTTADVGALGVAGRVPAGWVAFAITATVEHFAIGDRVQVFAADRLLGDGVVVARGEADLLVAVAADSAPRLAGAVLTDSVTVALSSDP